MGLLDVPEESFIEIFEDDLVILNDKKIESEKIIDKELLSQSVLQCHNFNCHQQTVWFGTVDNAATRENFLRYRFSSQNTPKVQVF